MLLKKGFEHPLHSTGYSTEVRAFVCACTTGEERSAIGPVPFPWASLSANQIDAVSLFIVAIWAILWKYRPLLGPYNAP